MSNRTNQVTVQAKRKRPRGVSLAQSINRAHLLFLLRKGRFEEVQDLVLQAREASPYDVELMRSVRVLEWYFDRKKSADKVAVAVAS